MQVKKIYIFNFAKRNSKPSAFKFSNSDGHHPDKGCEWYYDKKSVQL